jgi:hypothetical protein
MRLNGARHGQGIVTSDVVLTDNSFERRLEWGCMSEPLPCVTKNNGRPIISQRGQMTSGGVRKRRTWYARPKGLFHTAVPHSWILRGVVHCLLRGCAVHAHSRIASSLTSSPALGNRCSGPLKRIRIVMRVIASTGSYRESIHIFSTVSSQRREGRW